MRLSASDEQARRLWEIREMVSDANRRSGRVISSDTCVPVEAVPAFIVRVEARLEQLVPREHRVFVGHVGDGNIHVIVAFCSPESKQDEFFWAKAAEVRQAIFDVTAALDGSVSAEHGVGQSLAALLPLYKPEAELRAMAAVRAALDPSRIMNHGKVLLATSPR